MENRMRFGDVVILYNDKRQGWMTAGDQVVGWGLWLPKLRTKLEVPPRCTNLKRSLNFGTYSIFVDFLLMAEFEKLGSR